MKTENKRTIVKIEHTGSGAHRKHPYAFWSYEELKLGDTVVADTQHGLALGCVVEINLNPELVKDKPSREIISKVDFSAFDKRIEMRSEASNIRIELSGMYGYKGRQAIDQLLAEDDPEFAEKLSRLHQLEKELGIV